MNIQVKKFKDLSTQKLYQLLQLRSEVFVVEQACIYQDVDGKDQKALHVLGTKNNELVAYTRIFAPGDYYEEPSIGRVVVAPSARANGTGRLIMNASLQTIQEHFNTSKVRLSAQTYLQKFYTSLGFEQIGEGYLEDGIPHIEMFRK